MTAPKKTAPKVADGMGSDVYAALLYRFTEAENSVLDAIANLSAQVESLSRVVAENVAATKTVVQQQQWVTDTAEQSKAQFHELVSSYGGLGGILKFAGKMLKNGPKQTLPEISALPDQSFDPSDVTGENTDGDR